METAFIQFLNQFKGTEVSVFAKGITGLNGTLLGVNESFLVIAGRMNGQMNCIPIKNIVNVMVDSSQAD